MPDRTIIRTQFGETVLEGADYPDLKITVSCQVLTVEDRRNGIPLFIAARPWDLRTE